MKKLNNKWVVAFYDKIMPYEESYKLYFFAHKTENDNADYTWAQTKDSRDAHIFDDYNLAWEEMKKYIIRHNCFGQEMHVLGYIPDSKEEMPVFR